MENKIVLITGATSGIGKMAAIALAKKGAHVVITTRDEKRGQIVKQEIVSKTSNENVEVMFCDLSSLESVKKLAHEFKQRYDRLDVLINNAGTWELDRKLSKDGIELTFAVNHLAHFLLTHLLLDVIKKSESGRIINVSSDLHKFSTINLSDIEGGKHFHGRKAYGQSKLANVLFTKELVRRLNGDKITVYSLHPGVVSTELLRNYNPILQWIVKPFFIKPDKGAETTVYLAESPGVSDVTGEYFVNKKIRKSSKESNDEEVAKKLWQMSEEYLKEYLSN